MKCQVLFFKSYFSLKNNKKSAESSVAPAGIKSYTVQVPICIEKIYFAVFKKLMG